MMLRFIPSLIEDIVVPKRTTPRKGRTHKRGATDANHIPDHIGESFEKELDSLVTYLSESHGTKGRYLKSMYKLKYMDPNIVSPDERRSAAIEKWLKTEVRNSRSNQRLQLGDVDLGYVHTDDLVKRTRHYIAQVLGEMDYPNVFVGGSHTNGASTRIRRGSDSAILKHTGIAHVSSSCVKHWLAFASNSVLSDQVLTLQEHSVLFTVPKATEIDRVACKEPEINMFLQRTVGSHIRRRLRRFGIDLNDQTVNQKLAREACKGHLATIDLSAASDSITRQLVYELLPFDWWSLLDDLRVKSTDVDGSIHELEMFSSMGNGFTFELESLIFWALARSIMYFSGIKGKLSVYGDDIIVPSAIAPRLMRTFSYFGFKVNSKKSYWTGPFRESCGKHYHRGYDISPFFVREPVRKKTDVIRLLNRLLEWDGRGLGFISDPQIAAFHRKWARIIPDSLHGGTDPEDPSSLVTGDSPRSRLQLKARPVDVDDSAALLCWLTSRSDGVTPLSLDPQKEGRYRIVPQPLWAVRTTWRPYIVWPDSV